MVTWTLAGGPKTQAQPFARGVRAKAPGEIEVAAISTQRNEGMPVGLPEIARIAENASDRSAQFEAALGASIKESRVRRSSGCPA